MTNDFGVFVSLGSSTLRTCVLFLTLFFVIFGCRGTENFIAERSPLRSDQRSGLFENVPGFIVATNETIASLKKFPVEKESFLQSRKRQSIANNRKQTIRN